DIGVARRLASRQRPRVAAQIWKMLCNCLRCRQNSLPNAARIMRAADFPSPLRSILAPLTYRVEKSSTFAEPFAAARVSQRRTRGTCPRARTPTSKSIGIDHDERAQTTRAAQSNGSDGATKQETECQAGQARA